MEPSEVQRVFDSVAARRDAKASLYRERASALAAAERRVIEDAKEWKAARARAIDPDPFGSPFTASKALEYAGARLCASIDALESLQRTQAQAQAERDGAGGGK